jgi:hypothetical protein
MEGRTPGRSARRSAGTAPSTSSSQGPRSNPVLPVGYLAQMFLARNTLTEDAAGEDVIEICGGIKAGWQLRELAR